MSSCDCRGSGSSNRGNGWRVARNGARIDQAARKGARSDQVGYAGKVTVRVEPVVDFPCQSVRGEGCIQPLEEGNREVFMLTPTENTDPAEFRGLESLLM